jgi:anti-sigma factor RsiW
MTQEEGGHLSAITLGALLLGGLPPEAERRARAHLEQCAACAQRLQETSTSAEHFQREVEPRTVEALRQRLAQSAASRPRSRRLQGVVALGVLLGVALVTWLLLRG